MRSTELNTNNYNIYKTMNNWNIGGCASFDTRIPKMKSVGNEDGLVSKFYQDSVVFITGGTGFLGKVLVEKLLRVFLIKRVYLLVRAKNNLTVNERLEQYFRESVFDRLRTESPDVFSKVKAVEAKFDTHDLDISEENKSILWNEVDIVFNVVASVKFNEKLRDAVEINVLGTKKVLDLVMGMKHLKAFVHISTFYSNCDRNYIAEKVYEPEFGYEKIIEITRIFSDSSLEKLEHCLIANMPNTYTMTKRCSENLVNHRAYLLPAGIFRPPIILSTYKEPVPGWTDNLYGPSGLCVAVARGYAHVLHGRSNRRANLVPADYCVNAMIATAWDINRRFEKRLIDHDEMPVYNYMFNKNNITWGQYIRLVKNGLHDPLDKAVWYFSYAIIPSRAVFEIVNTLSHRIPSYLMDCVAYFTGQKQIYRRGYKKLIRVIHMMSYFGLNEWDFENRNMKRLAADIERTESKRSLNGSSLEFEFKNINWDEYFVEYLPGIKKYVFNEKAADDKCRRRYARLRYLHLLLKSTIKIFLIYLTTSKLWNYVLRYLLTNL